MPYSYSVIQTLRKILHFSISSSFCLTRDGSEGQRVGVKVKWYEMKWICQNICLLSARKKFKKNLKRAE